MWRTLSCKPNTSFCTQTALEWLPRPIVWVEEATVALRKSSSAGVKASQDKTSQQEKEKDKWRRRKNVLVWRGLLKPLPQAHREEREQPWGWDPSQQFTHGSNTCAGASLLNPQTATCAPDFYEQESPKHLCFISVFPGFPNQGTFSHGKAIYDVEKFVGFGPQCQQRGSPTQSANTISVISGL